jgi:hypothetical protein
LTPGDLRRRLAVQRLQLHPEARRAQHLADQHLGPLQIRGEPPLAGDHRPRVHLAPRATGHRPAIGGVQGRVVGHHLQQALATGERPEGDRAARARWVICPPSTTSSAAGTFHWRRRG